MSIEAGATKKSINVLENIHMISSVGRKYISCCFVKGDSPNVNDVELKYKKANEDSTEIEQEKGEDFQDYVVYDMGIMASEKFQTLKNFILKISFDNDEDVEELHEIPSAIKAITALAINHTTSLM